MFVFIYALRSWAVDIFDCKLFCIILILPEWIDAIYNTLSLYLLNAFISWAARVIYCKVICVILNLSEWIDDIYNELYLYLLKVFRL